MTTINTTFFVFICIFAVIGALCMLIIALMLLALVISGVAGCIEDAKKEKKNNCPYEVEGEKNND